MRVRRHYRRRESGLSLVELLIASGIAIFLLGGLFAIIQSNKRAFAAQSNLGQQADNERFAIMTMTNVLEAAGYYANPTTQTDTSTFAGSAQFPTAGQFITGTNPGGAQGDTVVVEYFAGAADNLMNCDGSSTTGAGGIYVNQFNVNATNQLVCTMTPYNGAVSTVPLVDNVQSMSVLYGVLSNPVATNQTLDSYLTAAQVTAAGAWTYVVSIKVTLTFINALATTPGQPPTISLTRVIPVMARA